MSIRQICLAGIATLATWQGINADDTHSEIQPGHNLLGEAETTDLLPGIKVGPLAFNTTDGDAVHLEDKLANGPVVFAFLGTQCPLAKRYTSRLNKIHQSYKDRGVRIFAVFPNSEETSEGIKAYLGVVKFPFDAVRDVGGYVAGRLGATMTPQIFVVDKQGVVRYRGPIDDNRYETRVKHTYLVDALDALLAGKDVETPSVKSIGCTIHQPSQSEIGDVTYTKHVARILQDNCQSCHRPNQVAPFALTNYEEARQWKTEIQKYTHARLMPPWKAAPGIGEFKNDVSMSDAEIAIIAKWVEQGTPMGDPADMPPAPRFNDGWAFGEPDLIVEMPDEYIVGPEGEDDYRHFIIPYEAENHRFIEAVDVRPGNRGVVHHVLAYADTSGVARKLDAADPGPGYTRFGDVGFQPASLVGGWAPGNSPVKAPAGAGRWLPKKCDIVMQVHYYRTGVEERDRTKLGIYFSRAPRPVPTRLAVVIKKQGLFLPKDNSCCEVEAEKTIEDDSYLFAATPHMHLLGKTMAVTAVRPDGKEIDILKIDDWDFNWQISYHLKELTYLPAGTKVKLFATFDNSADNPNNPNDPPKDVRWGEKTTDEMCIAFLGLLKKSEYDPKAGGRRVAPKPTPEVAVRQASR